MPCLNEEVVIGRTINRLLDLPGPPSAVLVINDGSEDGTADVVRSFDPERVWLLQPHPARRPQGQGRGAQQRHAVPARERPARTGATLHDVIIAVVDADGRLARSTLVEVAPVLP